MKVRCKFDSGPPWLGGFGTNMAIAKRLGTELGGDLKHTGGNEFSFVGTFRVSKEGGGAERGGSGERALVLARVRGLKVLIVDDSEINLKLLKRRFATGPFQELGWDVETARTGEAAVELFGKPGRAAIDLIVMDENMAEAGGILLGTDATALIRKMKRGENVIVIGCTGNCGFEHREKSKRSGQNFFWSKPVPTSEALLEKVTNCFQTFATGGGF